VCEHYYIKYNNWKIYRECHKYRNDVPIRPLEIVNYLLLLSKAFARLIAPILNPNYRHFLTPFKTMTMIIIIGCLPNAMLQCIDKIFVNSLLYLAIVEISLTIPIECDEECKYLLFLNKTKKIDSK
jgi:hypothetical protein